MRKDTLTIVPAPPSDVICSYCSHTVQQHGHCVIVLLQGAEIGINIEWKCNLDLSIERCIPRYSFTRLDLPFSKNDVSKGYNFRYCRPPLLINPQPFPSNQRGLFFSLNADLPNISRQTMGLNIGHFTKRSPSASMSWSLAM